MTPNEALDTLDRVYHSPLVPVVRAEVERLRQDLAGAMFVLWRLRYQAPLPRELEDAVDAVLSGEKK